MRRRQRRIDNSKELRRLAKQRLARHGLRPTPRFCLRQQINLKRFEPWINLFSVLVGLAAINLSHQAMLGDMHTQRVTILSEPYIAYEACVTDIEGKAEVAFTKGNSLKDGCYIATHALWNALANVFEIVGQTPSDKRHYDEVTEKSARRELCVISETVAECAAKLTQGMLRCRNNIKHDSLDSNARALEVYDPIAPGAFSQRAWQTWLQELRAEREDCLRFARSIDKRISAEISKQGWW